MSGKLDQSLDQIMKDGGAAGRRRADRPRTSRRAAQKAKAAIAAPTGGVQKNTKAGTKASKNIAMAAPRKPVATGDSKVIISGLPEDVRELELKKYIEGVIGPVRSLIITYGPDGRSRGIATVIFSNPNAGSKAHNILTGIKIDNRRGLKVELVANDVPAAAPGKTLADRVSKPKSAAKETKAAPKGKAAAAPATTNGAAKGKAAKGKKSGPAGRPKKKTADELDAEMMDYFGNEGGAATTNGATQPAAAAATNGGEPVDEVM